MLSPGFLKPEISVNKIGKRKFWIGIFMGISAGIILNYFLNYSRESLRCLTAMGDILTFSSREYALFDLFFSAISVVIGFAVCTLFWFRGNKQPGERKYHIRKTILANIWLHVIVVLLIIVRFGSVLGILFFTFYGIDEYLKLNDYFQLIFILLPIVLFFSLWMYIQRIMKSFKWIALTFIALAVFIILLWKMTPVNRDIADNLYYENHKNVFIYIDKELKRSDSLGIKYDNGTLTTIKKFYSPNSLELENKIRKKFSSSEKVSLYDIILEKMLVHKFHASEFYISGAWNFAFPGQIYHQILMHDPSEPEVLHLFELLREEIYFFNPDEIYSVSPVQTDSVSIEYNFYHDYDYSRFTHIKIQLMQVQQSLLSNSNYSEYHYLLNSLKLTWEEEISLTNANDFFINQDNNY